MIGRLLAVVGTDTGVGKTVIGAGLIHGLRSRGLRVAAFKPVETGLPEEGAHHESRSRPDWRILSEASGQPPDSCLGRSFPLPAAPLAAARAAQTRVDVEALQQQLAQLRIHHELVVVEGAGGLCVPFADGMLWADLLSRWCPDCLVVGRLGLGTVNHTLLTVLDLHRRGLSILGVILNTLAPPGPESPQTPALINEFGDVEILGIVPKGLTSSAALAKHLDAGGLIERLTSRYRTG